MKQIELPEEIETWLVDYMRQETPVNAEVASQKSRIEKFWCWMVYGHLYRDGVCLRCGKKGKGFFIDIDKTIPKLDVDRINELFNNPY